MAQFKPTIKIDGVTPIQGPAPAQSAPVGQAVNQAPPTGKNPGRTFYDAAVRVIQAPLRGIASGLRGVQQYRPISPESRELITRRVFEGGYKTPEEIPVQGANPLRAAWEGFVGRRDDRLGDVIYDMNRKQFPTPMGADPAVYEGMQRSQADIAGTLGEFTMDPAFAVKPFGLTKTGLQAAQIAKPLTSLAGEAEAGHRALLAVGNTPIIRGAPVLKAMTQAGEAARAVPPIGGLAKGFKPAGATSIPEFNYALETMEKSPLNEATLIANQRVADEGKAIEAIAKQYGVEPDALRKQMLDYMEPRGSQSVGKWTPPVLPSVAEEINDEAMKGFATAQRKTGALLPPEAKTLADRYIKERRGFKSSEAAAGKSYKPQPFYVPHYGTQEFNDFARKTFGDNPPEFFQPREQLKNVNLMEFKHRGIPLTINEVNNMAEQGRLAELDVFKDVPKLNEFKGKVFSDKIESVMANRYLNNAKVVNRSQFVNHSAKIWGKPDKVMRAEFAKGAEARDKWTEVTSPFVPEGKMWFPKEIGQALNGAEKVNWPSYMKDIGDLHNRIQGSLKQMYYGWYPKSALANAISNYSMLTLHGFGDLSAQYTGNMVAKGMRTGKLGTKTVVSTPKYGGLSEKQIFEAARKNRAYGMGQAQTELGMYDKSTTKGGKAIETVGKPGMAAQNFVEDAFRIGVFTEALKKGYTYEGAAKMSRKIALDYGELGELDKMASKAALFYTFTRKWVPTIVTQMVKEPGRFSIYGKVRNKMMEGREDDTQAMAPWEKQSLPLPVGGTKDKPKYLYAQRFLPQLEPNKWVGTDAKSTLQNATDQMLGMVTPYLKLPAELARNYSQFSKKPIEKMEGEVEAIAPGVFVPRKVSYALKSVRPTGEVIRALTSDKSVPSKAADLALGISVRPLDKQKARMFQSTGFKKDLANDLRLVRLYAAQENMYRREGRENEAEAARRNKETAIRNLRKRAVEERPVFRPSGAKTPVPSGTPIPYPFGNR